MRFPLALLALLLPGLAAAEEGFAPDPGPAPPSAHFRGDFRTAWGITDGTGVLDHALLEVDLGLQIGEAAVKGPPAIAPLGGVAVGIAEGGEPMLRVVGGLELAFGVHERIELVPAFFGGYFRNFRGDERAGPLFRGALGMRVLGDHGFFVTFEPVSFTVLPPPPGGFTRYTDHFTWDLAIIKFGGRS